MTQILPKRTPNPNRSKNNKKTGRNRRGEKRGAHKPPPRPNNRAGKSDQRRRRRQKIESELSVAAQGPRCHIIQKQDMLRDQPIFKSVKAKKEYRKGNFEKAIKIEIAYQKNLRSRRKKGHKKARYMKTSDSRTHIDPHADKVDYYCRNSNIRPEWDEELWYIEELWGNGAAQRWNNDGKGTWGFLCPYTLSSFNWTEENEF